MLEKIFIALIQQYTDDEAVCHKLWQEIEKRYSNKKRHYHNLFHIEAVFNQLAANRQEVNDWDTILFSLFYHDIVYNVLRDNNEQKSAGLAVKRLQAIGFPDYRARLCYQQILATRNHGVSDDPDTNLFTDADLSVLGTERPVYEKYCAQIRKEYAIFPDLVYMPGRKKVINHFLQPQRIFKTDTFFTIFERQARKNLQWELEKLNR